MRAYGCLLESASAGLAGCSQHQWSKIRPMFGPGYRIRLVKISRILVWVSPPDRSVRQAPTGAPNRFVMLTWRLPDQNEVSAEIYNLLKKLVGAQGLEPWTR
jgi:hypothetical protein